MSRATIAVRTKKQMKKSCDDLCRDIVRARGICEAFGFDDVVCKGMYQWAHIVKRSYQQVRWDIRECGQVDNSNCLCAAHHMYFTQRPLAEERFHRAFLGELTYEALKRRAEDMMGTFIDYQAISARLKGVIAVTTTS